MRHSLRSLPDTSLANHLTAAFGLPVHVSAAVDGTHAVLSLPSGACLLAREVDGALDVHVAAFTDPSRALTLDGLARLRLDLEVLARAGEIVEQFAGARLSARDFDLAAEAAHVGVDDEEVAEIAAMHADSRELDPQQCAALIEIAASLRDLCEIAIDNAPEIEPIELSGEGAHA